MRSALYYPHNEIRSVEILKTALLLWDRIELIVPYPEYRPQYNDQLVAEAMEMIGKGHCPTDDEKKEAHQHIEEFVKHPLPQPFYYKLDRAPGPNEDYEMYPQKLLEDTWRMLRQAQLAGPPLPNADYPLSQAAGLSMMSILADCCAGNTRVRVTDRGAAYATLTGLLGAQTGEVLEKPQTSQEQLVPITLKVVKAEAIDLQKLIDFRKREESSGGRTIRKLRHNYVEHIESYVKRLMTTIGNDSDKDEIERQFSDDMKDDLANLLDELRVSRNEVLYSKEIITAAIAGLGTVATLAFGAPLAIAGVVTVGGAPVTIGGLLGLKNKYLSARQSILQRHPMAYLYELEASTRRMHL